ncbi:MAG TPA: M20/M25/M40 family metallo-hydrolase, partial [Candidatus Saccharimonadales bacterium]|nr:M20/M25/M40 family metallo-hydrolase [Candidatus Saccharimonadales bacterium]
MSDSIDPRLLTSKWRLHMRPNTPSTLTTGETVEDILRDIIAMPSITGNYEANREGLNYIERFLSQRGMHTIRHEWNGIESLVATTRPTKTPTVFLMGHFDVVAAPADMFQLRQDDQKYYGRGVLDMKGAIAAFLATVNQLNNLQDYDFGIMITTDEEVGGFDGAQLLAQEGYVPKVMILPDGGANWNIERFCKGIWFTTFTATGKSAHGSRPWEGDNAITKLMDALREIQALFSAKPSETTST